MLHLFKTNKKITVDPISEMKMKTVDCLEKRILFLQLDQEDLDQVKAIASLIVEQAPIIARRHYDMICKIPEAEALIKQYSYEQKFIEKYEQYVKSIVDIKVNEEYVHSRKLIGRIHARIKLSADWFIASYSRFYEVLVPAILGKLSTEKAAKTLISLQKLLNLDAQIALEAYQEDHDFKFVETNSEIIESIIQIDQVRELLDSVECSMDAASSISSATEQLATSVQDIASHAVQVAENSESMVASAEQGKETIHDALNGMMSISEEISIMRQRFMKLNEALHGMTEVAGFINEVAEQTNLLALNASIEAARAGEEGRGFAVVANEVRKLSHQTSSSVEQIRSMIQAVQETATDVDAMTKSLEKEVIEKSLQTKSAISHLDIIIEQMVDMGNTTSNIAAIIEEQAAATEDISNRSGELLDHVEIIERNAKHTGKAIYDVSIKVEQLRNETINYMGLTSNSHMVRIVKTDHLLWRWWVYNSILGYHTLDKQKAGDAHACRLGKWYDSVSKTELFRNSSVFHQVDAPHKLIHEQVYAVIDYLEQGRRDKALEQLDMLQETSVNVVSSLDQLYGGLK